MSTVTKFASANTVVTTGWTNPTNAYADDGVYATAAPGKNNSITTDYGFAAFTTSDIPAGSTISSVTYELQYKADGTGSAGAVIGYQGYNGALIGAETTQTMVTADTIQTLVAPAGITLADLQTANKVRLRVRGNRSSSNTAITWSLDYVKVTVVYSATQVVLASGIASPQVFGKLRQSRIVPSVYPPGQVPTIVSTFVVDDGHVVNGPFVAQFGAVSAHISFPQTIPVGGVYPAGVAVSITGRVVSGDGHVCGGTVTSQFGTPIAHPGPIGWGMGGLPSEQAFGTVTVKSVRTVAAGSVGSAQAFGLPTIKTSITVSLAGLGSEQAFGTVTAARSTVKILVSGVSSAQAFGVVNPIYIIRPSGGVPSAQAFGTITVLTRVTIAVPGLGSEQAFGTQFAVFNVYLHDLDCFEEDLDELTEIELDPDELDCLSSGLAVICAPTTICGTEVCGGEPRFNEPITSVKEIDLEPVECA